MKITILYVALFLTPISCDTPCFDEAGESVACTDISPEYDENWPKTGHDGPISTDTPPNSTDTPTPPILDPDPEPEGPELPGLQPPPGSKRPKVRCWRWECRSPGKSGITICGKRRDWCDAG